MRFALHGPVTLLNHQELKADQAIVALGIERSRSLEVLLYIRGGRPYS